LQREDRQGIAVLPLPLAQLFRHQSLPKQKPDHQGGLD
jgi:hypothetical protein